MQSRVVNTRHRGVDVSHILAQVLGEVKDIPQEQSSKRIAERSGDILVPHIVGDMVEVLQVVPKKRVQHRTRNVQDCIRDGKNAVEFDPVDKISQARDGQKEGDKKSEGFFAKESTEVVEMFKLVNWRFVLRRPLCGGHV